MLDCDSVSSPRDNFTVSWKLFHPSVIPTGFQTGNEQQSAQVHKNIWTLSARFYTPCTTMYLCHIAKIQSRIDNGEVLAQIK